MLATIVPANILLSYSHLHSHHNLGWNLHYEESLDPLHKLSPFLPPLLGTTAGIGMSFKFGSGVPS